MKKYRIFIWMLLSTLCFGCASSFESGFPFNGDFFPQGWGYAGFVGGNPDTDRIRTDFRHKKDITVAKFKPFQNEKDPAKQIVQVDFIVRRISVLDYEGGIEHVDALESVSPVVVLGYRF